MDQSPKICRKHTGKGQGIATDITLHFRFSCYLCLHLEFGLFSWIMSYIFFSQIYPETEACFSVWI